MHGRVHERLREPLHRWVHGRGLREEGLGQALEALAFAFALPLGGVLLFPDDPLGVAAGFPWLAVGPALFAARYGAVAGIVCAAFAAAAAGLTWAAPHTPYAARPEALTVLAIGTLLSSLLIGEVSEGWRRRALRAEAESGYLRHRLERFSNDYHVLEVSHGQLEEYLAGQRTSLRGALERVRSVLSENEGSLGSGEALMAVFAQFCSVQVAGLYRMRTPSVVDPAPLAVHGAMGELPIFDRLLQLALAERRLVSVTSESAALGQHGDGLLVVVPIVDARGHLHAVLAVRDMHFMAFQQRNLNVLALLASHVGDLIGRTGSLGGDPAASFLAELDTALRFARSHAVPSSLVRLETVAHPRSDELAAFLARCIRGLDSSWIPPDPVADSRRTVAVLLPLVGPRGADAWLGRIAGEVSASHGVALADLLESARVLPLESASERPDCLRFIAGSDAAPAPGQPLTIVDGREEAYGDRAA